jgi:zinc protease
MMTAHVALLGIALAASAGRRVPPRAPEDRIAFHREVLEDGVELVVLPVPGATRASIRYVIRAGSAFDPPGKDGLAHLLEHVIATAGEGRGSLLEDVEVGGGEMNAFTSDGATIFALDAPARAFPELAARLVSTVTNPRLEARKIAREQEVVQSEGERARGGGAIGLAENALFRPPGSTLGTGLTRGNITREDLTAFYGARYLPSATTVVLAGDVTPDQGRALLERAFHLPPSLASERFAPRIGTPMVPIDEEIRAPVQGVVFGYRLDQADRALCDSLAELVGGRILTELYVKRPVVAEVDVACHTLRGNLFLLAAAYSRALDEGDLPAEVEALFRTAVDRPMTIAERATLERRRSRRIDALRESPPALAMTAAMLATLPREGDEAPIELLSPPLAGPRPLQEFARRALDPARRVRINLSPLRN